MISVMPKFEYDVNTDCMVITWEGKDPLRITMELIKLAQRGCPDRLIEFSGMGRTVAYHDAKSAKEFFKNRKE